MSTASAARLRNAGFGFLAPTGSNSRIQDPDISGSARHCVAFHDVVLELLQRVRIQHCANLVVAKGQAP